MNNEEFRKERESTLIGKLAKGTPYERYAIHNKILDKNKNFIEKKKGSAKFSFAFVYESETYGVWFDYNQGLAFVSTDFLKDTDYIFACTLEDHSPNTMLLSRAKKYLCWKSFLEAVKTGCVRYENFKIKKICTDLYRYILS